MDEIKHMTAREMWKYAVFQAKKYRIIPLVLIMGAVSGASVAYINSFLYAKILDELIAQHFEQASRFVVILVIALLIVELISKTSNRIYAHYIEPSNDETKKRTAKKAYSMEFEEIEKEETLLSFRRVRRGENGSGDIVEQMNRIYRFFTELVKVLFACFFVGYLFSRTDIRREGILPFLLSTGILAVVFIGILCIGKKVFEKLGQLNYEMSRENEKDNAESSYLYHTINSESYGQDIRMYDLTDYFCNMHYDGTLPVEKRIDNAYELSFEHVSFKYPGTEQYIIKDLSITFQIGEKLALVGRNGAGKTTLIKLLLRFYEPTEGRILLNGIDIGKYDQDEYMHIFSVVFQDFRLYHLPLDENIAGSERVDEERVRRVLDQVGMSERISHMRDGIHTRLYHETGDGEALSGGEAQKIAIARAIYKDAPFVILDEPTSALDPLAEAEIYENFNEMVGDKTAIYISHRMSSCKFCDKILVLEQGNIVESGTHEELMERQGSYYKLYQAQAKHYQRHDEQHGHTDV